MSEALVTGGLSRLATRAAMLRRGFDCSFAEPAQPDMIPMEDLLSFASAMMFSPSVCPRSWGFYVGRKVTRVPGGVPALLGIAGFRGAIRPVYNLATLLGRPAEASPRWLVIAAAAPIALAFDGFERHLRVASDDDPAARCERQRPTIRPGLRARSTVCSTHSAPAVDPRRDQGAATRSCARKGAMKMFKNWTVGRRLVTGFGLAGLTLLVIAFVSYRNITGLIENDGWVEHSNQVRIELADLLSEMKDAETGQRGYLLTGIDSYLEPHEAALREIKGTYADVVKLTADNPHQQRRLASLSPLIDSKLAELKETIELRRTQGFDAALKIVLNNSGKIFMDQIRAVIAEADQEEVDLLKQRAEEAHASADMTTAIILWGGLLGTIVVVAIGWFITRSLSQQIGSAVLQIQSSSAELQIAANQQATGAKEQSTAMTEISTTISELLATTRQIAESARRVARNSEQTAVSANSGHGTVDLTHESIVGHSAAGRPDRRPYAGAGQEIPGDRRRCRNRVGVG